MLSRRGLVSWLLSSTRGSLCVGLCLLMALAHPQAAALPPTQASDLDRELEEAKALYRETKLAQAIARLQAVVARLERLRDLEAARTRLADACVELAFSYLRLNDQAAARQALKGALTLDRRRRLDPQVYGSTVVSLLEEVRAEMGLAPVEAAVRPAPTRSGTLSVSSDVWVFVSIDGGPLHQTPFSIPLEPGRHALRATRPGFRERLTEVDVREGDTSRIHLVLERQQGFR